VVHQLSQWIKRLDPDSFWAPRWGCIPQGLQRAKANRTHHAVGPGRDQHYICLAYRWNPELQAALGPALLLLIPTQLNTGAEVQVKEYSASLAVTRLRRFGTPVHPPPLGPEWHGGHSY